MCIVEAIGLKNVKLMKIFVYWFIIDKGIFKEEKEL